MQLLKYDDQGALVLTKDFVNDDEIPLYTILSHTWEDREEVLLSELLGDTGKHKNGYSKLHFVENRVSMIALTYFGSKPHYSIQIYTTFYELEDTTSQFYAGSNSRRSVGVWDLASKDVEIMENITISKARQCLI
jgi:hypothetical protein